ncbi:helix-turn-helix domain-containing protein [Streptomyces sp.]|uniref:helix-turn-helix transcriptional regulator n=1 Tax=Streptomyces sp. TaxID=1931 RepID=UPI002F93DA27
MATATDRRTTLKTPEAATYIGVANRTLENWRNRGKGPRYIRAGRAVVYRIRDLDAFLDERTVKTTHT